MEFVSSQKANDNKDKSYRNAKTMPKDAGDFVDYKEIFADYAKEASYTSQELDIPNGMRDMVNAYFDSIQQ